VGPAGPRADRRPAAAGRAAHPCEELWVSRDAGRPWRFELLVDLHSTGDEWVYKRDPRVRLPWDRAAHVVDGVGLLRPEVALLFKAKNDRPKDRADLLAAQLDPSGRDWLADTLDLLGQHDWARIARADGAEDLGPGATGPTDQDWR